MMKILIPHVERQPMVLPDYQGHGLVNLMSSLIT
ncbi:MAG: hypothetical protein RLZZ226_972, partial [Pseudomonadota bacterium]